MTAPCGSASTSSAARACSALVYSTTGGHGARASEPAIAQPVSQSIAIRRAAGGSVEHLAVDCIVSLSGVQPFGGAPSASTGAAQAKNERQDRCCVEGQAQRFPRRAMGEDPTHHRWPLFQSSSRAWMVATMPIRAMAISTQRSVSRYGTSGWIVDWVSARTSCSTPPRPRRQWHPQPHPHRAGCGFPTGLRARAVVPERRARAGPGRHRPRAGRGQGRCA